MKNKRIWKTAAIIKETADAVTIVFDIDKEPFEYKPGQFINLTIPINGIAVTRSFSFSSSPDEDPSITIKKVAGGLMSTHIVDNAENIKEWGIDGPYGSFTPPAESKHIILLAGGSGITPLFSIAKSFIGRSPDAKVTLVYANKSVNDIIFRYSIEQWKNKYSDRVTVFHALSHPGEARAVLNGFLIEGRLNKIIAKKLVRQSIVHPPTDVHYFICGPSGLMKMHQEMLTALEVPETNIFLERFEPETKPASVELPQQTHEVMLHFYEQSNLLEVRPGVSILTAALEDRIPLPYSCKGGTCGNCTARLTAGLVTMPQNYVLRKEELDAGMILLCQSYPLNDEVTVEIG